LFLGGTAMGVNSSRWMDRVASLPCVLCGAWPVQVHHILEGRTPGRKSHDCLVLPLCVDHHQGSQGIHHLGPREWKRRFKTDELKLLAKTIEALA
jgi:hypothetical protein